MAFTAKSDHKIMELLGVSELRHLIAHTNKGELTLMLRKGETKYRLVLDAVPLLEDINKELMEVIFPDREIQKVKTEYENIEESYKPKLRNIGDSQTVITTVKKTGGRPKKTK